MRQGRMLKTGVMVALVGLLISCSSTPADPVEEARRGSRLACEHFRNVARDAADGIYTNEELRQKLREVDGNAIIGTREVQAAARAMLAAATQGDLSALGDAVSEMDQACRDAGW